MLLYLATVLASTVAAMSSSLPTLDLASLDKRVHRTVQFTRKLQKMAATFSQKYLEQNHTSQNYDMQLCTAT